MEEYAFDQLYVFNTLASTWQATSEGSAIIQLTTKQEWEDSNENDNSKSYDVIVLIYICAEQCQLVELKVMLHQALLSTLNNYEVNIVQTYTFFDGDSS